MRTKAPERWYGRAQIPAGEPVSAGVDMTAGEAVEVGAAVNNAQNDEGILRRQARSAWRGLDF